MLHFVCSAVESVLQNKSAFTGLQTVLQKIHWLAMAVILYGYNFIEILLIFNLWNPQGDIVRLIGLAVMGQNLILNMNDHGFTVAAFNRTVEKSRSLYRQRSDGHQNHRRALAGGHGFKTETSAPCRVMMLVKAGKAGGRIY